MHSVELPVTASTDLQKIGFVVYFNFAPDPYDIELPLERQEPISLHINDTLPSLVDVEERNETLHVVDLLTGGSRVYDGVGSVAEPFERLFTIGYELVWRADASNRLTRLFGGNDTMPKIRALLRVRLSVWPSRVTSTALHAIDLRRGNDRMSTPEKIRVLFRVDGVNGVPFLVNDTVKVNSLKTRARFSLDRTRRLVRFGLPVEWDASTPLRYAEHIHSKTMLGELIGPPRDERPSSDAKSVLVIEIETVERA